MQLKITCIYAGLTKTNLSDPVPDIWFVLNMMRPEDIFGVEFNVFNFPSDHLTANVELFSLKPRG